MIDDPRETLAGEPEDGTSLEQDEDVDAQMEQAESTKRAPSDEFIQGNGDRTPG